MPFLRKEHKKPRSAWAQTGLCVPVRLFRELDGARLANDADLDLTRILHFVLDALDDLLRKDERAGIVDVLGLNHDANLAARLNGEALFNALERIGDFLELLEALDVVFDGFAARAGTGGGNRIRGLNQNRLDARGLDVVVVRHDAVNNRVGFVILLRQFRADGHMGSLDLVVDGLADVVQKARALGERDIRAQLGGHDARQVADLDGVPKHVLAVGGAVAHAAQQLHQLRMDAVQIRLEDGLLAGLADLVVHLALGLLHHLLDAGGVDAAVHDQLLQGDAGHLAANRIEGGDDHGLRRVVDDQIDAGGGFEGADVAALAADDAALHVVVGQRHHGDGGLRHVVGGALLNRQGDDVAGLFVGLLPGLGLHLAHHHGGVVVGVLLNAIHQDLLGLVGGHAGDALQLGLLAIVHLLGLGLQALNLAIFLVQRLLPGLQVVQFLVELLLALVHPALQPRHLVAAVTNFFIKLRLQADDFFLGLKHGFLFLVLRLARGLLQHVCAVFLGLTDLLLHAVLPIIIAGHHTKNQRNQHNQCDDCMTHTRAFLLLFKMNWNKLV